MRLLVLALMGIAGSAMASFDLLLVADSTNNVVHRYDGDTGVYLGNFGGGFLGTIRGITVDKALNVAYVSHSNGYSALNYHTGEHLFYSDLAGPVRDLAMGTGGTLMGVYSAGSTNAFARMPSPSTSASAVVYSSTLTAGSFSTVGQATDGRLYALNTTAGELMGWNTGTTASTTSFVNANLVGPSAGAVQGMDMVVLAATGVARRITVNTGASQTGFSLSTPFTSAVDFEFAHAGEGYGLGVNASGTRLQRYQRSNGGTGGFFDPIGPGRTLSQVGTPVGMAIVTAPEPGTMIALGAGALALLRRRRK